MKANTSKTIEDMTFEEALNELENIVKKLESGKESLEQSMEYYEIGNLLKNHCQKKLKAAQLRIDRILQQADGTIVAGPDDSIPF